jgi:hypothetical protein
MKKIALNPADLEMIKHYLLGGAALGAGAGGATALLNQLNDLHRESAEVDKPNADVLKLTLRDPNKQQQKVAGVAAPAAGDQSPSLMRGPLSIVAGLLGAGAGYAGVRGIHQYLKKRDLQAQLDAAQNGYLDVLDSEAQGQKKKAAAAMAARKGMQTPEALWSVPLSAAMLLGLSSGVVSNQVLRHAFPDRQPGARVLPKRVVVHRDGMDDSDDVDVPVEKQANAEFVENVAWLGSSDSDIRDAVFAAAAGRFAEMKKVANDIGPEAMLDVVKGYGGANIPPLRVKLAARLLSGDPEIGPTIRLIATAEFVEKSADFFQLARNLSPSKQRAMLKYASRFSTEILGALFAQDIDRLVEVTSTKSASHNTAEDVVLALLESKEFEAA